METLQELKAVNKQERDIDRFRSSFRGYQLEECIALRNKYQSELLEDLKAEVEEGRKYLMPLLIELTEEFEER